MDRDHPSGQTFDVLDGGGSGDMQASVYDSDSAVSDAGGIKPYVEGELENIDTGGLFIAKYGISTYAEVLDAYKKTKSFIAVRVQVLIRHWEVRAEWRLWLTSIMRKILQISNSNTIEAYRAILHHSKEIRYEMYIFSKIAWFNNRLIVSLAFLYLHKSSSIL